MSAPADLSPMRGFTDEQLLAIELNQEHMRGTGCRSCDMTYELVSNERLRRTGLPRPRLPSPRPGGEAMP